MPGGHVPSRRFAGGLMQPPSGPPEPIGPGDVVRLVAFWVVLVGGSVAGAVTHSAYLLVGPWFLFAVLVVVAFRFDGERPDPAEQARTTADSVVADLRALRVGQGSAAQDVRPEPDAPRVPQPPPASTATPPVPAVAEPAATERAAVADEAPGGDVDSLADSLADLGALVAVRVEERISGLLAVMERRSARAQWRFFLLGVPVGFLVNWASARLWG